MVNISIVVKDKKKDVFLNVWFSSNYCGLKKVREEKDV